MCGIVGYVGEGHAKERIIDGLKRLEYRGYDSAAVSYTHLDVYKRQHKYPGGQWSENRYRGTYRACCKENN